MKIKKISDEKALDQALILKLKNYRYCVLFYREGKNKITKLFPSLTAAENDLNYAQFEEKWSDRQWVYTDKTLGFVARVELMALPKLEAADRKKIHECSKSEHALVKTIKRIYDEYGYMIASKSSYYTTDRRDNVRALLCWSEGRGVYVGSIIKPKKKKNVGGSIRADQPTGNAGGSVPVFAMPLPQRAGME